MSDTSKDTCFSLIERLEPLFREYGEEQIVVALMALLQRDLNGTDAEAIDEVLTLTNRIDDLDILHSEWCP